MANIPIVEHYLYSKWDGALRKFTIDENTVVVAQAAPGANPALAVWQMYKAFDDGTDTIITWADGNVDFDNIANDFATITFS